MDRLGAINGLRGIAVVGTIFHHSFFEYFRYAAEPNSTPWLVDLIASSGWLGVNLFFFLSGFVLYLPYEAGKRYMRTGADVREFYRRRFLRLIPLYTLVWIVSLIFMTDLQLNQPYLYKVVLLYVTVTYPFYPGMFYPPGNWVMWSLGAEIWFSVLFPLVLMAIHRPGWMKGLALAMLGALAVRIAGQLLLGTPATPLNMVSDSVVGRLDEFVLGMYAAHLYRAGWPASVSRLFLGAALLFVGALIWDLRYIGVVPPVSGAIANDFVDVGVFLITLTVLTTPNWVSSLMQARSLQLLGVMCYSVYMWHGIVLQHFEDSLHSGVLPYVAYLGFVFVISAVTFRYVEFPRTASWKELIPPPRLRGEVAASRD